MTTCPGGGGTVYTTKNCMYDSSTGKYEEINTMCGAGDTGGNCAGIGGSGNDVFCTKAPSTMKGTAWMQRCYTRDSQGNLYSISGSGPMPQQINRQSGFYGNPVTSADPQDFTYLTEAQPGALSRAMYKNFIAPWWENVFGVRQQQPPSVMSQQTPTQNQSAQGPEDDSLLIVGLLAISVFTFPIISKWIGRSK
tara:strand:- start:627 stop:1208 length:582 start_codon:yes stop_codon:yes gene_type:complete